tara:strand:- start:269 stop:454 length:186 start_codon:yes stop_codon:yes gene_type:complete
LRHFLTSQIKIETSQKLSKALFQRFKFFDFWNVLGEKKRDIRFAGRGLSPAGGHHAHHGAE